MAIWLVLSALLGVGFWALVVGVAAFVGCVSMVSVTRGGDPRRISAYGGHRLVTESVPFRNWRDSQGALPTATFNTAWPMRAIALCATCSILFYLTINRRRGQRK